MLFLINLIFDLYIFIVLLRLLLQLFKANFYNPVSQMIVKVTDPVLKPIQRIVSGFSAPLVLVFILQCVKFGLLWAFATSAMPGFGIFLLVILMDTAYQILQLYFYMILIVVLVSWINPVTKHPAIELLYQLTEPVLQQARRFIPPLGSLDLSPVVVLIVLKLLAYMVAI